MQTVTTIGLDIAKSVFQVHGQDGAGQVVIRRQLKRRYVLAFFQKLPPCLIGIEAFRSRANGRGRMLLHDLPNREAAVETHFIQRSDTYMSSAPFAPFW